MREAATDEVPAGTGRDGVPCAASASDLPEMADVYRECFPEHGLSRLGRRTCRGYLRRLMAHEGYRVAVVRSGGALAGFAVLQTDRRRGLSRTWLVRDAGVWLEMLWYGLRRPLWPFGALARAIGRARTRKSFENAVRGEQAGRSAVECTTWLELIAVRPAARRQGVGARLVAHCLELTARTGRARMGLRVSRDNAAAVRLYEKLGFVRVMDTDYGFVYERDGSAPEG